MIFCTGPQALVILMLISLNVIPVIAYLNNSKYERIIPGTSFSLKFSSISSNLSKEIYFYTSYVCNLFSLSFDMLLVRLLFSVVLFNVSLAHLAASQFYKPGFAFYDNHVQSH